MPMLLTKTSSSIKNFHSPSIVSGDQFWKNWEEFTSQKFRELNWDYLFCAGGSILGCVDCTNVSGSDIDLFIYGCSETQAFEKLCYLVQFFSKEFETQIVQTKNSLSIVFPYPRRNIQIILRLYHSPAEILLGFDIDCCAIGFDGKHVWAMERCIRALNKRYNLTNPSRRSTSYEYRLYKYSKRGFAVCVPSLNGSRISQELLSKSIWQVEGLAKLILYHRGYWAHQFLWSDTGAYAKRTDQDREALEETLVKRNKFEEESDYADIVIPYGENWDSKNYKRFFSRAKYGNPNRDQPNVFEFGSSTKFQLKKESIQWLQIHPGQQTQMDDNEPLMTGSFHPLSSKRWEKDVYE